MFAVEHNWPTAFEEHISAVIAYNDFTRTAIAIFGS